MKPSNAGIHRAAEGRRLFCNDLTPRHTQRHNIRQWIRQVRALG